MWRPAGITLDTLEADANVILTAAGNTAITNDAALALQGAVTGTLAATATTGGITDSSNLSATGNVTLNDVATAGITLDSGSGCECNPDRSGGYRDYQ